MGSGGGEVKTGMCGGSGQAFDMPTSDFRATRESSQCWHVKTQPDVVDSGLSYLCPPKCTAATAWSKPSMLELAAEFALQC